MATAEIVPASKRLYVAPALTKYGSVRELTGNNSGLTTGDANTMMILNSDRSYKENIQLVGQHPSGLGLYLFDYKAEFRDAMGHGRKFGVMADEVEKIFPEAVVLDENGYRGVRYDLIGITLH